MGHFVSITEIDMTSIFHLPLAQEIQANVRTALAEDVGPGDLTAQLIPADHKARAQVIVREDAILCGTEWFDACFHQLNPHTRIVWHAQDGDRIRENQLLCEIEGQARTLLTGERSSLNFLQLLSGVATKTRRYADVVHGTRAQVVDTRKTLPGLRLAQKYAVSVGGGGNHRIALWDAILIKENHILAAGSIRQAVTAAEKIAHESHGRCRFIQVEVENLAELEEALDSKAPMILLDNFSLELLHKAVALNQNRAILEASGGINMDTLRAIAETGVDRISIGTLTKDVTALDLSMRFTL